MSGARIRERGAIFASLGLLVVALVVLQFSYPEPGLLYLAPALFLLAALAFDRYPGERLLAALSRAWRPVVRAERGAPRFPAPSLRSSPRGGALLAMGLAGRGPPSRSLHRVRRQCNERKR